MQALLFILEALLTLVVIAFLLRLVIPLARASFRNPLGEAVLRITDPLVKPLRGLLKPAGHVDLAAVAALLIVQLLGTALLRLVAGLPFDLTAVLVSGLRDLASTVLQFYVIALLIYVLLSWIAPGTRSPATDLLARLCEPLLRPVRRVLPPIGGLDLSPLFVLIGLQAVQILLR